MIYRIADALKWYLYKSPELWLRKQLYCRRGEHKRWIMFITDGSTTVRCRWCRTKLEPTPDELARHPNLRMTSAQLAKEKEQIEQTLQWLDKHYRDNGR